MTVTPKDQETETAAASVVDGILETFVAALAAEPDMAAIAARLRSTIIERRSYGEAGLRTALFDEEPS